MHQTMTSKNKIHDTSGAYLRHSITRSTSKNVSLNYVPRYTIRRFVVVRLGPHIEY